MYYVMESTLEDDAALIGRYPNLPLEMSWMAGRRFAQAPPVPLVFELLEDSGTWMSAFYSATIPLMRQDLVAALERAGVDNLDRYEATIVDPRTDVTYTDYVAVNVIGVVSAADLERTQFDAANPSRLIDADIDALTIDETRAGGALFFRLAESIAGLIAHDRVRRVIEPLQLPGVAFIEPERWIG